MFWSCVHHNLYFMDYDVGLYFLNWQMKKIYGIFISILSSCLKSRLVIKGLQQCVFKPLWFPFLALFFPSILLAISCWWCLQLLMILLMICIVYIENFAWYLSCVIENLESGVKFCAFSKTFLLALSILNLALSSFEMNHLSSCTSYRFRVVSLPLLYNFGHYNWGS